MTFRNHKVLAIIPARGGSKGLPKKNIVSLNGKPLIHYSINAGLGSENIDAVLVSSDDEEILHIAKEYGTEILKRPNNLSTDTASINHVILHVIEDKRIRSEGFEAIVLLQPTSPLRTSKHIDDAFERLNKHDSTSLISVYIPKNSPFKCFVRDQSGYLTGLVNNKAPFMNRQELPEVFMPNGAIYIFNIDKFLQGNCIPVNQAIPLVMSEQESIDIDTQDDVDLVEKIMQKANGTYTNE